MSRGPNAKRQVGFTGSSRYRTIEGPGYVSGNESGTAEAKSAFVSQVRGKGTFIFAGFTGSPMKEWKIFIQEESNHGL